MDRMFFTIERFASRVAELAGKRYYFAEHIAPFTAMEGTLGVDEHYHQIPEKIEGSTFGLNDFFVGRDKYLWLEKTVKVPQAKEGFDVVGLFDFGKTGGGHNHGFESLLYVDGQHYQGVDTNHKEVFFSGLEEQDITLTFMLWTGLEGYFGHREMGADRQYYHQCKKAEFAYLHKKTDELYYFAKAISETLRLIGPSHEYYEDMMNLLDKSLNCLDWDGGSSLFYESVDAAHAMLMAGLGKMEKRTNETVHAVGHTHIDVAWLWRLKHTREKAQRSFSTVLRLMERYDEYVFLQSQPQLYKYIKEDCPELYARIKARIAEGRWEPEGGMWIESDCNVTSGESLVRQLLYGTRFIEQEFGKKCEYLWLPDVFGYSWALPQILKQCEIDTFMTIKISWSQFNSMPDDLFRWRGIDGSEILAYFINVPEDIAERFVPVSTYNSKMTTEQIYRASKEFKNKELTKDYLISYGFGDGGGGVNRDMLEMRRAMDVIPGLPNVKPTKAGDFFRLIHENVDNTDRYVHTWDGELYLEYHRGTYTSQAYNKKMNRHLENKLAQIEWLSSVAYILGGEYAQKELQDAWECVLLHQFHDIIPGSSINEVYTDSRVNYTAAEERADKVLAGALETVAKEAEHTYSVYSTNSFAGQELVLIPETEEGIFTDAEGNVLPAQKVADGYEVLVKAEAFGAVNVKFVPQAVCAAQDADAACETATFTVTSDGVETPFYIIQWNENGQLTTLFDKEAGCPVLKEGQLGNVLEFYEDKPMEYDAWELEMAYTLKKPEHAVLTEEPQVIENGSLKAVIRFNYTYRDSAIVQDMILYRDSRRIDFKTWVDWKESHKLFKTAFYTDIRSTKATYDIQFGHVERPTHWSNSWDWGKFEVVGHKWADLSETGYGVSLLNNCKYGYSIKDNVMTLSLLKSAKHPDPYADMGEHEFTYSLLPHMGNLNDSTTIQEANALNLPAQVVNGAFADTRKLAKVSSEQVQIDVIKKAEDEECLVVRLHECRGGKANVVLSSEFPVQKIVPCNMLEHDCGETVEGAEVALAFKPFEIMNFKLYF